MSFITSLLDGGLIMQIGAALVALLGIFIYGRRSGKASAEAKVNKERIKSIETSNRIARENDAKSDDQIDRDAQKWTR